ncbi:hypothetical protein B0H34DRAFT_628866, partial [Crassisporium funariophilum]
LADSGLPGTFCGYALLYVGWNRNRLPTSVLPTGITPFEAFRKVKPDLSVARIFSCFCYVSVPPELRPKGGLKRFAAIFVGYVEDQLGWLTVDLKGKEFFSRDVIFDELRPGRLG